MSKAGAAYKELLGFLAHRRQGYSLIPQTVLDDLKKFCRADESTWDEDASRRDVLLGRREVWLRIQEHLTKAPDELATLYGVPNPEPRSSRTSASNLDPPPADDEEELIAT